MDVLLTIVKLWAVLVALLIGGCLMFSLDRLIDRLIGKLYRWWDRRSTSKRA